MTGITNPEEAYFKDGLWTWDNSQWRKQPLLFGYTEEYVEDVYDEDSDAGNVNLNGSVVPAGEIWVVTNICAFDVDNALGWISIMCYDGTTQYTLKRQGALAAGVSFDFTGWIVLPEGWKVRVRFGAVTLHDTIRLYIWGFKMSIVE